VSLRMNLIRSQHFVTVMNTEDRLVAMFRQSEDPRTIGAPLAVTLDRN